MLAKESENIIQFKKLYKRKIWDLKHVKVFRVGRKSNHM